MLHSLQSFLCVSTFWVGKPLDWSWTRSHKLEGSVKMDPQAPIARLINTYVQDLKSRMEIQSKTVEVIVTRNQKPTKCYHLGTFLLTGSAHIVHNVTPGDTAYDAEELPFHAKAALAEQMVHLSLNSNLWIYLVPMIVGIAAAILVPFVAGAVCVSSLLAATGIGLATTLLTACLAEAVLTRLVTRKLRKMVDDGRLESAVFDVYMGRTPPPPTSSAQTPRNRSPVNTQSSESEPPRTQPPVTTEPPVPEPCAQASGSRVHPHCKLDEID